MPRSQLHLFSERFPQRPAFDTAVSHALLRRVGRDAHPASLRLYEPDDVVVFSLLDARRPGYAAALAAAREQGCAAVLRLAGGHAALFHRRTLAFSWLVPDAQAHDGIRSRFEQLSGIVARALRALGVDARVGEVPGEYCPGEYSVNAGGRRKLMGVGQRVVRGAAHVGGVIVVEQSQRVRDVLGPVYRALELEWDPQSAGAVAEEQAGIGPGELRRALGEEFGRHFELCEANLDAETLGLAGELESWHRPEGRPAAGAVHAAAAAGAKTLVSESER